MFFEKLSLVVMGMLMVLASASTATSNDCVDNCTSNNCTSDANGLIIKRTAWNARAAKSVSYLIVPLAYVTIHHTVTPNCRTLNACAERIRNIQSYHMDEFGWNDIGFSYLIGHDGKAYEGVGWNKEGAHTYGWNKKSAGIAFIGNFQNTEPGPEMLTAARELINCGKLDGSLRANVKVLGARQLVETLSPGNMLYERIKQWPEWSATP